MSILINNKNITGTSSSNSIIKTLCVNYKNGTKLLGPKTKQIQKWPWVKWLSERFANDRYISNSSQIQNCDYNGKKMGIHWIGKDTQEALLYKKGLLQLASLSHFFRNHPTQMEWMSCWLPPLSPWESFLNQEKNFIQVSEKFISNIQANFSFVSVNIYIYICIYIYIYIYGF